VGRPYASGENYRIELERGLVVCTVVRRPDLSRVEGARAGEEGFAITARLANESRLVARALVIDVTEAPATWGPDVEAAAERMLAAWAAADRPVAVVVSEAIQKLTVQRIIEKHGPTVGRIFTSLAAALAALAETRK
jgi:hypothetical protein